MERVVIAGLRRRKENTVTISVTYFVNSLTAGFYNGTLDTITNVLDNNNVRRKHEET